MTNRYPSSPIFLLTVVSLLVASYLPTHAEPGVPSEITNAPTIPSAPVANSSPPVTAPPPSSTPATPAAPQVTPPSASPQGETPIDSGTTYKVKKGDSLWTISRKYHTTVEALKQLNNLTTNDLKLKQVLKIPVGKNGKKPAPAEPAAPVKPNASSTPKKSAHEKTYARAQTVQDFDVPASTFASCPTPVVSNDDDGNSTASFEPADTTIKGAPIARLVSPDELSADETATPKPAKSTVKPTTVVASTQTPAPSGLVNPSASPSVDDEVSAPSPAPLSTFAASSSKQTSRALFSGGSSSSTPSISSDDWGNRFMNQARQLGDRGINYSQSWRPPQESKSWVMDCSNTTRYLYKITANITLPRTASDQYYYLHQQGKAWDVPDARNGFADCNYLRRNLKPGDLLFWENTYKPERQPPITHVMIFLGTNEKNQWIMAGSQSSRGGEHNRRRGGPDIYVFDPTQPSGGYTSWMGLVRHKGKFCAYGRPLEADTAKLAVVANN